MIGLTSNLLWNDSALRSILFGVQTFDIKISPSLSLKAENVETLMYDVVITDYFLFRQGFDGVEI